MSPSSDVHKNCPACKADIPEDSKFCDFCGVPVEQSSSQPATASEPATSAEAANAFRVAIPRTPGIEVPEREDIANSPILRELLSRRPGKSDRLVVISHGADPEAKGPHGELLFTAYGIMFLTTGARNRGKEFLGESARGFGEHLLMHELIGAPATNWLKQKYHASFDKEKLEKQLSHSESIFIPAPLIVNVEVAERQPLPQGVPLRDRLKRRPDFLVVTTEENPGRYGRYYFSLRDSQFETLSWKAGPKLIDKDILDRLVADAWILRFNYERFLIMAWGLARILSGDAASQVIPQFKRLYFVNHYWDDKWLDKLPKVMGQVTTDPVAGGRLASEMAVTYYSEMVNTYYLEAYSHLQRFKAIPVLATRYKDAWDAIASPSSHYPLFCIQCGSEKSLEHARCCSFCGTAMY